MFTLLPLHKLHDANKVANIPLVYLYSPQSQTGNKAVVNKMQNDANNPSLRSLQNLH